MKIGSVYIHESQELTDYGILNDFSVYKLDQRKRQLDGGSSFKHRFMTNCIHQM